MKGDHGHVLEVLGHLRGIGIKLFGCIFACLLSVLNSGPGRGLTTVLSAFFFYADHIFFCAAVC